jgi:hypothetical protein
MKIAARLTAACCFYSLFVQVFPLAAAPEIRPLLGTVVMAISNERRVVFLWDASLYVERLASDGITGTAGMRAIETTALETLAHKIGRGKVRTCTIRVTYAKKGAIDPQYGTPTFAGVATVLTLTATTDELEKNAASWEERLASGASPPHGLNLVVSGDLPHQ